jgi:hypothetical protein
MFSIGGASVISSSRKSRNGASASVTWSSTWAALPSRRSAGSRGALPVASKCTCGFAASSGFIRPGHMLIEAGQTDWDGWGKRAGSTRDSHNGSVEFASRLTIAGQRIQGSQKQIAILERLHRDFGHVVSYKELCQLVGRPMARAQDIHLLRQYFTWIKQTLRRHRVPFAVAVASDLGYALCETDSQSQAGPRRGGTSKRGKKHR